MMVFKFNWGTLIFHYTSQSSSFGMLATFFLLLGFPFHLFVTAQISTVAPPSFWKISNLQNSLYTRGESDNILPVLYSGSILYRTYFGFFTADGQSFTLSIVFSGPQQPVVWSANPDSPVNRDAILNFTREEGLLLHDRHGTIIWSTATQGRSVAGMSLDVSGNLVLHDQDNFTIWQSFDQPSDTLVMGQSLCRGKNISARTSNRSSARVYLSAQWDGLHYSFEPAAYTKLFPITAAPTSVPSTCYKFVNGSLGFPDKIFSLPSAEFLQFMRLESDGHLRLYEMKGVGTDARLVLDVLSISMKFCDYPLACGDYSVCHEGQCYCPSFSLFKFQNERLPTAGCVPLTSTSCNRAHDHQLALLNNVSYFSDRPFLSLATQSTSEKVCKQSCLMDCSCKVVIFKSSSYNTDVGNCLLLSEQNLIMFAEDTSGQFLAFAKIQRNFSEKKRVTILVCTTIAGILISILLCGFTWKRCKKNDEQLFVAIPGVTMHFSFHELKVATGHFSTKLGGGGFGSVFQGKIGREIIAVKRLEGVEQGMDEFLAEVKTIGRIHHLNLVRLLGFCAEKSHRLLVYEYMSNGSLDKWLFQKNPVFTLSWTIRRKIITAIARSLAYLHEECEEKIAHLDIKPQNILLDDKFNAKLSDFGLSKMINRDHSKVMTRMRGTRGYLAPEWLGSTITEKADIYSFGIVMMEIICGRENLDESQPDERIHLISLLQEKAKSGDLSDLVDKRSSDMQLHMMEVMQTMKLAMWCLQVDSSKRPLMSTVAKVLEGVSSLEATPDCTFVPTFATGNTSMVDSGYRQSESLLSGPR